MDRLTVISQVVESHKRNRLAPSKFLDLPELDDRAPADFLLSHQKEIAYLQGEREIDLAQLEGREIFG